MPVKICKMLSKNVVLTIIGAFLTLSGIIMTYLWPSVIEYMINRELKLSPSSRSYSVWQKTPIPLFIDFYFFNWTNPEEIRNPLEKPNFQQLGPYRFKETKEKTNIKWQKNGTVTFQQLRKWYFQPESSNGSLTDEVTTLNVVTLTAVFQARYWNYFIQRGMSLSLGAFTNEIHITKTVGELLFDGYEDPLINLAKTMPAFANVKIPDVDRFGWFYKRNGSTKHDGIFNMATGENTIDEFGVLKQWNNSSRTLFYEGVCSEVTGSAGEFWPPNRQRDHISLFSPDLCRSISFDYDEDVDIFDLKGYKYSGGSSIMDNGTLYPENECFCNGDCVASGALNVSSCRWGAPAFVSFPHFYNADPVFTESITGLKPDKEKHNFYIVLEPKTGIPLDVAARFQINILLYPSKHIGLYQDIPKTFIPVLWFEQHATITEDLATALKHVLNLPLIGLIINSIVVVIGVTILIILMIKKMKLFIVEQNKEKMIEKWGKKDAQLSIPLKNIIENNQSSKNVQESTENDALTSM